jgi:hypothetical protein
VNLFDAVKEIPILQVAADVGLQITKQMGHMAMAVCPFHEDHVGGGGLPNLSMLATTNRFKCHKCGEKGSVLDLWIKMTDGDNDLLASAKSLAAKYNVHYDDEKYTPPAKVNPAKKWKQDKYSFKMWDKEAILQAHANLMEPEAKAHLDYFCKLRHLTPEYVVAKKIGLAMCYAIDQAEQYDFAFTIPAFEVDGTLLAIRLHSRFIRKHKKFVTAKKLKGGSDPTTLYDLTGYKPDGTELWICEGEGDLWTIEDLLKKNVVTSLCGANSVANTLAKDQVALGDLLKKERIVLCPDNDKSGLICMSRVRVQMPKDAKVFRIHWPDDYVKKEDVSFYFNSLGKSYAEFEQLLQPYTFEEAEAFLKIEQEKMDAKKKGTLRVYEYGNCYFRIKPGGKKPDQKPKKKKDDEEDEVEDLEPKEEITEDDKITSFVISGKATVEIDNQAYTRCDVKTVDDKVQSDKFLPPETWLGKKEFMKQFMHTKYVFQGSDRDVQEIMQLATKFIPEGQIKKGCKVIGYIDHHNFVGPGFIISKDGIVEDGPYEYIKQGSPFDTMIKIYKHDDLKGVLREFCSVVLNVNTPEVVIPTLGWMFACFFKDAIHKVLHYFPILSFFGTSGAGKTSYVQTMMRLFGTGPAYRLFNANATKFSVMKMLSGTNCIPVAVDELKENIGRDAVNFWQQRLKNVFFGEVETRGNKDQTVSSFEYTAPLLILGEMSIIREQAIAERTIAVRPERYVIDGSKTMKAAFIKLDKEVAVEALFPRIIQWVLAQGHAQMKDIWKATKDEITAMKLSRLPSRVWDNYVTIMFGVNMFEQFAKSMEVPFSVPGEMKKAALTNLAGQLLQVGTRPKIAFDEFLEALAIMAKSAAIKSEQAYVRDGETLYIHLNSCVPAFRKWARETNWDGEVMGRTELFNQAKEVMRMNPSYVVDHTKVKSFGPAGNTRCVMINLRKAEQMRLDITGFGFSADSETPSWQEPAGQAPAAAGELVQKEFELPPELTEPNSLEGDMFGGEGENQ